MIRNIVIYIVALIVGAEYFKFSILETTVYIISALIFAIACDVYEIKERYK